MVPSETMCVILPPISGIVKDPQEVLNSVLQAHHLKIHVYSKPYNPAEIFEHLKADLPRSSGRGLAQRIQRIIEADRLFHFTALDLQLHTQVTQEIRELRDELMADEVWCEPDGETVPPQNDTREATTSHSLASAELKNLVQGIIEQFLKEGIIYRSADPIGGKPAYYYTLMDRRLAKRVCKIISMEQKDYERGVPFNVIFEKLRSFALVNGPQRPYRSVTRPTLAKMIYYLLEKSKIYAANPDCYKMA
ncbi:hypothetical protein Aperf_G00000120589 [Anoplocephala perfoliata]